MHKRHCHKCGKHLHHMAKACHHCGARINPSIWRGIERGNVKIQNNTARGLERVRGGGRSGGPKIPMTKIRPWGL